MPRVSVIMPCFNHASFIGASIEAVLAQTLEDLELIVVDDCSRDHSKEVIEKYAACDSRIKPIYHQTNLGASRSRNDGMKVAQGEYLAFCDADDVWMPLKLARQIGLLEEYPQYDVAYCDALIIDEGGVPSGERFSDEFPVKGTGSGRLFEQLCIRNFINMQTVVLRREAILETGYFDQNIKWVEDWWFWARVSYRHSFIYTNETLAKYRVHQKSTGRVQRSGYRANRVKVFHRIMRNYPGIRASLKSDIYYHMGVALAGLGKRKYALGCFSRSVTLHWSNFRAFCGVLLSLGRIILCRLHDRSGDLALRSLGR